MESAFVFISFILGLVVGSFLNVLIIRSARQESLGGRSHCPSCNKSLSFRELIPVLSFLLQKGRCRHCGTALSRQYPLVELGTAAAFMTGAALFNGLWAILLIFIGISAAIVIFVSDLRFQLIPNGPVLILTLLGITAAVWRVSNTSADFHRAYYDLGAAAILSAIIGSLWLYSQGKWMGLGDAKLIFPISLILGFPASLSAFLFSFWLGGTAGILLLTFGQKTLKSRIPFGPFILAGSILAYFFSSKFIAGTGLILLIP